MVSPRKHFFALGGAILLASCIVAACASPIDDTGGARPPGNQPPAARTALWRAPEDSPWCSQSCAGLRAWDELVPNPLLRGAMYIAYQYGPQWRPLADRAAAAGVKVVVESPRSAWAAATYTHSEKLIRVSPTLLSEPSSVIASVLAHEVAHANQSPAPSSADCYRNEGAAYAWQAYLFEAARRGFESSDFAVWNQQVIDAWRDGRLEMLVRNLDLYKEACGATVAMASSGAVFLSAKDERIP